MTASHSFRGDATVIVSERFLLEVARSLKEDPAFQMNFLMDLTAVDFSAFGTKPSRGILFLVRRGGASVIRDSRHTTRGPVLLRTLASPSSTTSFPCRSSTGCEWRCLLEEDDPEVDSVTSLWAGADWLEREVWDMFGIRFRGHPNLKRILMYDEFVGHPLRKDYPVNRRQPLIGPVN